MAATISPNFNAYRAPQPGNNVILIAPDYADTMAVLSTPNGHYFHVAVRSVHDCFANPQSGQSSQVYYSDDRREWIVDYNEWVNHDNGPSEVIYVEADSAKTLHAALGSAVASASERGHEKGLW